jgi:hypothetical protein
MLTSFFRFALTASLAASVSLHGQGLTGSISGSVADQSGSPVPGAEITLNNAGTGQNRNIQSDSTGGFVFTQLLPSTYKLTIVSKGFRKYEQTGIVLTATERVVIKRVDLQLGEISQTVEVMAETARLQTQSAERSGLISLEQTQNVPLKGRDYLGLVKLLPGVIDTANRNAPGWNNLGGITINGNRQGTINLTLDGVSSLDTGSMGGPYLAPSVDAVAEVKVLLTNYQAEYGRSSGGTINTIIKSGTREFHGGAYYFLRNEALNANEFFRNRDGLSRPQYRFNYPGYFLGGPVPMGKFNKNRDKLFFFWSQEFLPRKYPSSLQRRTFPTALQRNGDFSQTFDTNRTLIPIWDPLNNRVPFPGNVVPANRIDRNGQALLNIFPQPNAVDPTFNFNALIQAPITQPRRDSILRIDYNLGSKTQFYWRGIQDYEAYKGDFDFVLASASWAQLPINYQIRSVGSVATLIHTFSPTLVNEFTFGVNRAKQTVDPLSQEGLDRNTRSRVTPNLPQFFPSANPRNLVPQANFGGIPNVGVLNIEQRFPFFGTNNIWNWSNNLSKIWGPHNTKFGIYVERTTRNAARGSAFNGTFNFNRDVNNPLDSNFAYSNALLGSLQSYTEADAKLDGHARYLNVEWFAQDTWKVTRRFTIDAGVRFYFIQPTWSANDTLAAFDLGAYDRSRQPALLVPSRNAAGARVARDPRTGTEYSPASIGQFADGVAPFQGMTVYDQHIQNTPGIQVAPRVGFAWDVFGNAKTAVRGGVGVFYDRFNDDQVLIHRELPPNVITRTAVNTTIAELLRSPFRISPPGVTSIQRDFRPPTVYNWSFGIQQNVGFGTVLDVAYVGNVGRRLLQRRSLNALNYGTRFLPSSLDATANNAPLPDNFLRPLPGYADIQYIELAGTSNYHSLQTQVNKRFSKGLQFGVAWTWSKAMTIVNGNNEAVNPFLNYRMRQYGRASFDRTHNFVLNYLYDIPKLSSLTGNNVVVRGIFDNWQLSGLTTFTSGQPLGIGYTLVQAADLTGASGAGVDSRINVLSNPILPKSERTELRHFNTGVFAPPTRAELGIGNAPKDVLRGPGINVFDVTLIKNIPFGKTDQKRLQLRFEFYNFFNHASFQGVDTTARFDAQNRQVSGTFGQYTSTLDARRVVLGAKFYF